MQEFFVLIAIVWPIISFALLIGLGFGFVTNVNVRL